MVGATSGNGHPYSWSAILNGFKESQLLGVPYPRIREYLKRRESIPMDPGAAVTHVWAPNNLEAERIASFANISNVCRTLDELIPEVDAIIHARDDHDATHLFLKTYMKAQKPVLIDKPFAVSLSAFDRLIAIDGVRELVFTGSALKYDPSLVSFFEQNRDSLSFDATGPGDWEKYGLHLIEPIVELLALGHIRRYDPTSKYPGEQSLRVESLSGVQGAFTTKGRGTAKFQYQLGSSKFTLSDPYHAFSTMLARFLRFTEHGDGGASLFNSRLAIAILEKGSLE